LLKLRLHDRVYESEEHPDVMWHLIELGGLTLLSLTGMTVALAHESALFVCIFAVTFGLGGAELVRRALSG
jgi:hypothetical protein